MKYAIKIFTAILIISFISCEVNINSGEECLECSYQKVELSAKQKVCNDLGTEDDMEIMRDRMQMEADSLNVTLTCKRT